MRIPNERLQHVTDPPDRLTTFRHLTDLLHDNHEPMVSGQIDADLAYLRALLAERPPSTTTSAALRDAQQPGGPTIMSPRPARQVSRSRTRQNCGCDARNTPWLATGRQGVFFVRQHGSSTQSRNRSAIRRMVSTSVANDSGRAGLVATDANTSLNRSKCARSLAPGSRCGSSIIR